MQKLTIWFWTLLVLACLYATNTLGQESFSGSIVFDLTYEGEMAEMFATMMPSSYTFHFQEDKMSFQTKGGMTALFGSRFIIDYRKGVTYMLNDAEKIAYEIKHDALAEQQEDLEETVTSSEVRRLDESLEIAGYTCQKYEVVVTAEDGTKATQYLWATSALKITPPSTPQGFGNMPASFFSSEEIEGFPLKVVSEIASQGVRFKMIMTASQIEEKTLPESDFLLPEGYQVKPFESFRN